MSCDFQLTKEQAEQYLRNKSAVDLLGFTAIADDAAECLSNYEGDELVLLNVETLSGAAAESLSKYKGELWLSGLTCLSDSAAVGLSKHRGGLILDGLSWYALHRLILDDLSQPKCPYWPWNDFRFSFNKWL